MTIKTCETCKWHKIINAESVCKNIDKRRYRLTIDERSWKGYCQNGQNWEAKNA